MITPTCPKCRRPVPAEEINVANDVAYCRPCNLSHRLSGLTERGELNHGVDLNKPPDGVWRHADGSGMVIGATHRSLGAALGTLVFALVWNGLVGLFLLSATVHTLQMLNVSSSLGIIQSIN